MLVFKTASDLNGGGERGGSGILDRKILVTGTVFMAEKSVTSKDRSGVIRSVLRSLLNQEKDAAVTSNWTSLSNSSLSCCIFYNEFFVLVIGGKNIGFGSRLEHSSSYNLDFNGGSSALKV